MEKCPASHLLESAFGISLNCEIRAECQFQKVGNHSSGVESVSHQAGFDHLTTWLQRLPPALPGHPCPESREHIFPSAELLIKDRSCRPWPPSQPLPLELCLLTEHQFKASGRTLGPRSPEEARLTVFLSWSYSLGPATLYISHRLHKHVLH